jgi:hypothetical protein
MVAGIADAELFFDDYGDAGAGPDLAMEPVSFRPMPHELRDEAFLLGGELRRMARRRPARRASVAPRRARASQRLAETSEASKAEAISR